MPYLAATGGSADDDSDSDSNGGDEDRIAERRARWVRTQTWARRLTTQTLAAEGQKEAVRGMALMVPGCVCRVQLEVARTPDAENVAAALALVDGALRTAALTWADLSVRAGPLTCHRIWRGSSKGTESRLAKAQRAKPRTTLAFRERSHREKYPGRANVFGG